MSGNPKRMTIPSAPTPSSKHAYTRRGCRCGETSRGRAALPRHNPPMYTASSSPNDTADEPITSCSNCNQTISYIKAAHPLPASSSNRIGTAAITLHRSEPAQEATRQKKQSGKPLKVTSLSADLSELRLGAEVHEISG